MFYILFIFLIGICVGSFLNVLVFRTHEQKSLVRSRSKCQKCEMAIAWYDLVPVLSFFLLRQRCRHCKSAISWQYPLVELATGLLFVLVFLFHFDALTGVFPATDTLPAIIPFLVRDLIFSIFLIVLFVYDFKYQLLLDRFTIPAMVVALLINLFLGVSIWSMLMGAIMIGGFFFVQWFLSKGKWIGDGDIRMGTLMGLMLGLTQGLVALFLAYILGAAVGVVLLVSKKARMKTQIPFGTFLAVATFVALLWGEQILQWYLGMFI
ncbi:MAG: prepilin peptidase [Candidatus Uhrbacteria bacterium]